VNPREIVFNQTFFMDLSQTFLAELNDIIMINKLYQDQVKYVCISTKLRPFKLTSSKKLFTFLSLFAFYMD